MLVHFPRLLHVTQVRLALQNLHRAVLHVNVGLHLQQVSTAGHPDDPVAVV